VPELAHGVYALLGEKLNPVAATIDPFAAKVRAAKRGKLGYLINLLPVPAGHVLRIVDLMPRPQRSQRVVTEAHMGTYAFAACVGVIDLHRSNNRTTGQLCGAAVMDGWTRGAGLGKSDWSLLQPLAHAA
jgi:hypothetical protein